MRAHGDTMARAGRRTAALLGTLALALGPAAAGAGGASPLVSLTVTDAPDPVTASTATTARPLSYVATVSNDDTQTVTHVTLTDPLPAGTTFVSATASTGSCTFAAGAVTCGFGSVASGRSVTAQIVVRAPATPGDLLNTVTAHFDEGVNDATAPDPKQDTIAATATTAVAPPSQDAISQFVAPAGATVTTDLGTGATGTNPTVTSVTVPATAEGAPVSLLETPTADATLGCGAGASCFGEVIDVTIPVPPFAAADPLRFSFVVDRDQLPPGTKVAQIALFHDGVAVPDCVPPALVANPATCVRAQTQDKKTKDVRIDVLATTNGRYRI